MTNNSPKNVIVYGGNGFVGSHIAQELQALGAQVVCASRSGNKPKHLEHESWADMVEWRYGDATNPDVNLLASQDVVITAIGAPPLPTITRKGYAKSLHSNGTVNQNLLIAAQESGVKRAIVVGAKIPQFLQGDWFAYAKGKELTFKAAEAFSQAGDDYSAVIVQPGGVFGTRYTAGGTPIPLHWLMAPLARLVPQQLINVKRLAKCAANAAVSRRATERSFTVITHAEI